jgi:hypothetical protein
MVPPRRLSAATGRGGWAGLVFEEEAVWDLGAASPGGAFARSVQRDSGGETDGIGGDGPSSVRPSAAAI